jgi:hypothetical protein
MRGKGSKIVKERRAGIPAEFQKKSSGTPTAKEKSQSQNQNQSQSQNMLLLVSVGQSFPVKTKRSSTTPSATPPSFLSDEFLDFLKREKRFAGIDPLTDKQESFRSNCTLRSYQKQSPEKPRTF